MNHHGRTGSHGFASFVPAGSRVARAVLTGLVVPVSLAAAGCGLPGAGMEAKALAAVPPARSVPGSMSGSSSGSLLASESGSVARQGLPFRFARDGYGARSLSGTQRPFRTGRVVPRVDQGSHDAQGVRMVVISGRQYDHPNFQANYGLANLESYQLTGDRFYLGRALAQARRLRDRRVVSGGAWFHPYDFDFPLHRNSTETMRRPWYSGLAQGKVLAFFTELARVTGDPGWRKAADCTFDSFLLSPDARAPWVSLTDRNHLLWLVEYPFGSPQQADQVFNGHLSATFGLWDYYQLTRDRRALAMYDGAVTTVHRYRASLRVRGGPSIYCLTHGAVATSSYHRMHSLQLVQLSLLTGRSEFAHLAQSLVGDSPYPVLAVPRRVDLAAGRHVGFTYDIATGKVTGTRTVTLKQATTGTTVRRMRLKGRGIYYRMGTGSPLAGMWVPEQAGLSMVRGVVSRLVFRTDRRAVLAAGHTYTGLEYDSAGNRTATVRVTARTDAGVSYDAVAWIGGVPHLRIVSGKLRGYWVMQAQLTKVA